MTTFDSFRDSFMKDEGNLEMKKLFGENPLLGALKQGESTEGGCPLDVVKLLLECCAQDVTAVDENGDGCLHVALRCPNNEAVILQLLERGAEVNRRGNNGFTPLLVLLQRQDCSAAVLRLLIRYGADVNCCDADGETTSLVYAMRNASDDLVVRILLEAGAEFDKGSILMTLLDERKHCSGNLVRLFLNEYGADANYKDETRNSIPLMRAIDIERNEDVLRALLEGGADVNKECNSDTPLLRLVGSDNCSVSAVKLFLDQNANVNFDCCGNTPLRDAITSSHGSQEVIRTLLDRGAIVDTADVFGYSTLCNAFECSSHNVVKMLLDKSYSTKVCKVHRSTLYCALDNTVSELREDILDRLIKKEDGLSSRLDYPNGDSVFCYALGSRHKVQDLELLLKKGASLSGCRSHDSPFMCASSHSMLRECVVQWLLNKGVCIENNGLAIMGAALKSMSYDGNALHLLLDQPGMVEFLFKDLEYTFACVFENPFCEPAAMELLLSRLCQVQPIFKGGYTVLYNIVLHGAVERPAKIMKVLLKYGFPVNVKDAYGETPLVLAVKCTFKYLFPYGLGGVKPLLIAGARIKEGECLEGLTLLDYVLSKSSWNKNFVECFKLLVEFSFLQKIPFDLVDCSQRFLQNKNIDSQTMESSCSGKMASFFSKNGFQQYANDCLNELKVLESYQIEKGFTLCEFVRGYCLPSSCSSDHTDIDAKNLNLCRMLRNMKQSCLVKEPSSDQEQTFSLDQLLTFLAVNQINVYLYVFAARLNRAALEKVLFSMDIYTSKKDSDKEKICLNEDVLHKISNFLSKENLLRFILAFYNVGKSVCSNGKLAAKRSLETTQQVSETTITFAYN